MRQIIEWDEMVHLQLMFVVAPEMLDTAYYLILAPKTKKKLQVQNKAAHKSL